MIQKDYELVKETIEKYGLKPASVREVGLFTMSAAFFGYLKELKDRFGFSYEAIITVSKDHLGANMFNEKHVGKEAGKFIEKRFDEIDKKVFEFGDKAYEKTIQRISALQDITEPWSKLKALIEIYDGYVIALSFYNCINRYLATNLNSDRLTPELIKKISKKRDLLAKIYPDLEIYQKDIMIDIGKKEGFDGELLRYLTRNEARLLVGNNINVLEILDDLKLRKKQYLYVIIEEGSYEKVFTDPELIQKMRKEFIDIDSKDIDEIEGQPVFKGKISGKVYNMKHHTRKEEVPRDSILVTSMTQPKDLPMIKKCIAVITDEGGILCHAAVTARELQKPCIIGTKIATRALKDGDLVEVDADKGVVRIIKK
ncbi:hypothetical protein GOV14_05540 [Candidatus Pacearchaeota archaeon]|nr:hypothetical protein [Candidatus Pacearchaeota archaeon]